MMVSTPDERFESAWQDLKDLMEKLQGDGGVSITPELLARVQDAMQELQAARDAKLYR